MSETEKKVDESWKNQIERERETARVVPPAAPPAPPPGGPAAAPVPGATAGAPPPGGGALPGAATGPTTHVPEPPPAPGEAPDAPEGAEDEPDNPLFEGLLQSLAVQATLFLGLQPDPRSGLVSEDLGQAKQIIDMLGTLELKTRGNLTQREAQLVQMLLQDLRFAYVQKLQAQAAPPGTPGMEGMPGMPPGGPGAPGAPF